jgi:(p)ppGpp synthase/HD superfamily hydrolase
MFSPELYLQALTFAARAHGEQKTLAGLPYVVHLSTVCMEVLRALRVEPGHDEDLAVACALLHDVLEDTPTRPEEVEHAFGRRVREGVMALTKDSALPEAVRMEDSLRRIRLQPLEVAIVKLADRITNLASPPPLWTAEKIAAYREEAKRILAALSPASPSLGARLADRIAKYPGRAY